MPPGSTASFAVSSYVPVHRSPTTLINKLTMSVPLKYSHPCSSPHHADRLSLLSRSPRLYADTTRTTSITCHRGGTYLRDAPSEPCAYRCDHHQLHPAGHAWCSTCSSRHACITKSCRVTRFARFGAIDGTSAFAFVINLIQGGNVPQCCWAVCDRVYTCSRRSYNCELHSRQRQRQTTMPATGYSRPFRLMRHSDWCSIGASLLAPLLRWLSSGCVDGPKSYDVLSSWGLFRLGDTFPLLEMSYNNCCCSIPRTCL